MDDKKLDRLLDTKPIEVFLVNCQAMMARDAGPEYSLIMTKGKKYYKILQTINGQTQGVWGFVEISSGNILKAASFNAPAKHARGNINDASGGMDSVEWTGPKYLR